MFRKVRFGALVGLFVAVCVAVGVLVWPTPKEARAANWPASATLFWHEDLGWGEPRNVHVTAQLLTTGWGEIGDPVELDPVNGFKDWEEALPDGGLTPYYIRFTWDYDPEGADNDRIWIFNQQQVLDPSGEGVILPANTYDTHLEVTYIPM